MYLARNQRGTGVLSGWAGYLYAAAQSRQLRRALRPLSYLLMAGVVGVLLLVATATMPVLFGYHTYIVKSGSMEPNLRLGSVAVTSPTSPQALNVGDIVAWHPSPKSMPVLHRIVEITYVDGKRSFVTQGDQNHTPDREPRGLEGPGDRVVYSVPYAGYVLSFAEGSKGRAGLIGLPLAFLVVLSLREGRRSPQVRKEPEAGLRAVGTRTAPAAAAVTPITQQVAYIRTEVRSVTARAAPTAPVAGPFKTERSQDDLPVFLVRQLQSRGPFEPSTQPAAASSTDAPAEHRGPPSPEWPQRTTRRVA